MAQTDSPYGFRPVGKRGETWHGQLREVIFADTDVNPAGVGSMVKFTGESIIDPDTGKALSVVTVATPADVRLAGAIVSFQYGTNSNGFINYRAASTQRKAYIPQDRDVMYSVQEDGNTLTLGAVEGNIDFTAESVDTTTGNSTMKINPASLGTLDAIPLRIVELEENGENSIGAGNFPQWVVTINQDAYSDKTGL